MQVPRPSTFLCAALVAIGALLLAKPQLLAARLYGAASLPSSSVASLRLAWALAGAFVAMGGAGLLVRMPGSWPGRVRLLATAATFLLLTHCLHDWMVDDAGITFAFSENLVRGHGLVLHPGLPPEEAYSNTLWLLWLALLRWCGLSMALAAKLSSLAIGLATVAVLYFALDRFRMGVAWLLASLVLLGAPQLVWSVSGLEHGLQGLSMLLVASLPWWLPRHAAAAIGAVLCVPVLVRPEAPLAVAACFVAYAAHPSVGATWRRRLRAALPVALLPFLAWAALMAFRLWYFGDPLPNPYYAKAGHTSFLSLLNPFGGNWQYLTSWAFGSGVLVLLPSLVVALRARPLPLPIALASALLAAQAVFVLYASDWMGCWRFVSPALPCLALMVGWASGGCGGTGRDRQGNSAQPSTGVAVLAAFVLVLGSAGQYLAFLAAPTTPLAVVATIGAEIKRLCADLGVADPLLAHHDAGGTSHDADIRLLDLGGLGSRTIAKHMREPEFLCRYILEEQRPEFVFGVKDRFAAGASRFWADSRFVRDYVPVEFVGMPLLQSDLCHVRRGLLDRGAMPERIRIVRRDGVVERLVVDR